MPAKSRTLAQSRGPKTPRKPSSNDVADTAPVQYPRFENENGSQGTNSEESSSQAKPECAPAAQAAEEAVKGNEGKEGNEACGCEGTCEKAQEEKVEPAPEAAEKKECEEVCKGNVCPTHTCEAPCRTCEAPCRTCEAPCRTCEAPCRTCEARACCGARSVCATMAKLFCLLTITVLQSLYFIVFTNETPNSKFLASIRSFFQVTPLAREWLLFLTVLLSTSEVIIVAIKVVSCVAVLATGLLGFALRLVGLLIVPIALAVSLVAMVNYAPRLIPSKIDFIAGRIPELPEGVKERADSVVSYLTSRKFVDAIQDRTAWIRSLLPGRK